MKYISIFILVISFVLISCSDKNEDPKFNDNKLIGYWAITHIKTIEHKGDTHDTTSVDIPPHGIDNYAGEDHYRYDVLIFDENYVTVRGDMPSCPKPIDYDLNTTEGQLKYNEDFQNWNESIGPYTDEYACPVGKYYIKRNDLIIGTLSMGIINFVSNDEFTLDYKKTFNNSNDYRRLIYTYTRIYSLTL